MWCLPFGFTPCELMRAQSLSAGKVSHHDRANPYHRDWRAGRVSYALLFRIAAGAMFGADQPVALSLLEVPGTMPQLDATMMELDDCAFPLLTIGSRSTDAAEAFAAADWVITDW